MSSEDDNDDIEGEEDGESENDEDEGEKKKVNRKKRRKNEKKTLLIFGCWRLNIDTLGSFPFVLGILFSIEASDFMLSLEWWIEYIFHMSKKITFSSYVLAYQRSTRRTQPQKQCDKIWRERIGVKMNKGLI